MTLAELVAETAEEIGYGSSPTTEVETRLTRRINEWHRRLLAMPGLTRHLRDTMSVTLTTVAGTAVYGLPASVGQLVALSEGDNDIKLQQRSLSWLRTEDPGLTAEGVPECYIPLGLSPVQTQPTDASTLYVKSTSASDTTQVVTLRYLDASGREQTATATLTGTTAAAIGSGVMEVTQFRLSAVAVGTVTLHEDAGAGTELSRIPVGAVAQTFRRVQLWPTPQAAIVYTVDAIRTNRDLTADADEPLLPADFHYLLRLGATADEMRMRDDTRYDALRIDMERGIKDLKNWIWNNADYQPTGVAPGGHSRLGSWFPRGS